MNGFLITFEGVEGCGKSTQIALLARHIEARGRSVLVTREPGGVPIAETIRSILLDPENEALCPVAELLLYAAARAQHVAERIQPAIAAGTIVLSDRFADSTSAYQGDGRGIDPESIAALHRIAAQGIDPALTIVLDVPAAEGLRRATHGGARDRIEREALAFHERVREGFLRIAEREPARVRVVDGLQSIEAVAAEVRALVDAMMEAT